jgi:predicted metal-binding membrane protein
MNLTWMLGITIFVLLEKVLPGAERVARPGGTLLAGYGAWMIWSAYN